MAEYERIKRLGAGNFGEVWLVFDQALAVRRAVKYIPPSRISDPTDFYKEPQTLMALRHDNIVEVQDAGKTPDGTLYVAMEYLPKGSVDRIFNGAPIPMRTAFKILEDISWAVEYAHQRGYIHRDIKPGNILLTGEWKAKLSDFGLATNIPRGGTASPYGYLTHVAPEVLRTGRTSKASDIYAIGVTAYRLINGDGFLPEISEHDEIQDLILSGKYPDRNHYRPCVPSKIKRIINRCMDVDPIRRFQSAADFRKALEGISIFCDWRFKRRKRMSFYYTKIGSAKIKVAILPKKEKFDIETTKEVIKGQSRRIINDCRSNLTVVQMKKAIRLILQRYVTKGK